MSDPSSAQQLGSGIEPEVHICGEIVGGSFPDSDSAFACWQVKTGDDWTLVGGDEQGRLNDR